MSPEDFEAALQPRLAAPVARQLPEAAIAAANLEAVTPWGSHVFGEYRRCQHASQLARSGIVPVKRLTESLSLDYFQVGSAVHAALAYVWEGLRLGDGERPRLGEARDWRDGLDAMTLRPGGIEEDAYHEAERLLSAYFGHYGGGTFEGGGSDWDGFRVEAVEELIADEASFALPYTARLDLVLRDASENIVLVDTKTRAKAFPRDAAALERYRRGLRTREQFLGQAHLAMIRWGLKDPPPVIVNAIIKTRIPEFARLRVPLTLHDVEAWRENHAREALEGLDGDRMNYSECAPEIGSPCRFLTWCHGTDAEREKHYERKDRT